MTLLGCSLFQEILERVEEIFGAGAGTVTWRGWRRGVCCLPMVKGFRDGMVVLTQGVYRMFSDILLSRARSPLYRVHACLNWRRDDCSQSKV